MRFRADLIVVASVAWAGLLAIPAWADVAAEDFLSSWVEAIDASPDYQASYSSLTSDDATDSTTMVGLRVDSATPGLAINVDRITVTGFIPTSDDRFAAAAVRIEGATIGATEFVRLQLANAEFRDFSMPTGNGFTWDYDHPFISVIKALSPLRQVSMSTGRISSVVLLEKVEDVESRIAYEQVNIDGWSEGRIAAVGAGPITSQSPAVDQLTAFSIASAQSRDIDLNAFFQVYDPDNYVGGVGDRVWRTLVGKTTYRDMIAAVPGVTFTMKEATVEGLKLRQPKGGIAILADLGPDTPQPSDDPAEALKFLELLTSYGVGAVTLSDIAVTAPGVNELSLANLSISDYSSDRLGEFAIDRLAVSVEDQGAVSLHRFAFGDLVPPSLEAIIAATEAEQRGGDVDIGSVLPTLGFLEAAGVNIAITDRPPATLERFRIDLKDYVGPVPTTVALDLVDADVDAGLIEDERARQMLDQLGYDRVVLNTALRARWTNAGDMIFDSFNFAMKDVGAIFGDATLSGILPTEYMSLGDESALEKLSFVRGSVTAKDDSIVGRGLALQAEQLNVDPEAFREQFAMGLPFMLAFLGDAHLQAELAPVLQQFIKTAGGSITMVASPPTPLPVLQLAAVVSGAPFELLKSLNVTFSGIPGLTPAPAAVAPAPGKPTSGSGTQFDTAPAQEEEKPSDSGTGSQFEPGGSSEQHQPSGAGTQFQ